VGGVRDRGGERWRADTMVVVHSTTKGLAAMVMAVAHSRGLLDYDERVCAYWPEFAQAGKERITVRMGMNLHGDPRDVALRDAIMGIARRSV
jgi:CubicO group peptidase (beta-lactamase class C family)